MDWGALSFLAEPWFVLPWYAIGVLGAGYVFFDIHRNNTPLKQAMKWAWPIIVLFFSVIGLALYFGTARAPRIARMGSEEEKRKAHQDYERNVFRRVNGAVIHCVAGDGLGIMTAMVIARILDMTFWMEFWFEYLVGFVFGWFIFQFKSMLMMTESKLMALAMAFRAEFFSMLTVMAGMGAVMTYVTPSAIGAQPAPTTYGFWGFGMLGLLVGYVLTFPMNWWMVNVGWKHGMGSAEGAPTVQSEGARYGLITAMVGLGAAALVLPAWLTELREGKPIPGAGRQALVQEGDKAPAVLAAGLRSSLRAAMESLDAGRRSDATHALDAALRSAETGAKAAPESRFQSVLHEVERARRALHMADEARARDHMAAAARQPLQTDRVRSRTPDPPQRYRGVPILNAHGVIIGEVLGAEGDRLELALGGHRDLWGFWDWQAKQTASAPVRLVVFGPRRTIGKSYVALPTFETAPVDLAALE